MIDREAAWLAHQRKRWMRPDAYRFIRPDAVRFLKPGTDPADVYPALDRKYSPSQRRIPRGQRGGGRWTDEESDAGFDGVGLADAPAAANNDAQDTALADETAPAFQNEDGSGSLDDWNALLDRLGDDSAPQPIPSADAADSAINVEDVNARRGTGGPGSYFPGASAEQQVRLDLAIARGENALTQIRQYDQTWKPRGENVTSRSYGVEAAIGRAEARAAEAEARLDRFRTGIGGNFAPPIDPLPRTGVSPRAFDGGAWIDAYRTVNNAPNLFGEPVWPRDDGTVAVTKIDGTVYFGVNSGAPGYREIDRIEANIQRWNLMGKFPEFVNADNIGGWPNDAHYHAEANILERAARNTVLADRTLEVQVDRPMCRSCYRILPLLGLELGNPTVTFVNIRTGSMRTMRNGSWQ